MDIPELGQMLLDAKLVSEDQLRMAVEYQQKLMKGLEGAQAQHVGLPELLVRFGMVREDVLTECISKQQNLPLADLKGMVLPENLIRRMPRKLIETYKVIPIAYQDDVLTIATSDPMNLAMVEAIQLSMDERIELAVASPTEIKEAIRQVFYAPATPEGTKEALMRELEEKTTPEEISPAALWDALIPLLLDKGIITREELIAKAKTMS